MIYKLSESKKINAPAVAAEIVRELVSKLAVNDQMKETFWGIGLNNQNIPIYCDMITMGTLNYACVHPREVYKTAIVNSSAGILVAHNHPSGETKPSPEDRKITRQLVKAGKIIGIPIVDHIIITNPAESAYYSFAESGGLTE